MVRVGASKLASTVGRAAEPLLRWQVCTCRQPAHTPVRRPQKEFSKTLAIAPGLVYIGSEQMFIF